MASQETADRVQAYNKTLPKSEVDNSLTEDELEVYANRLNRSLHSLQTQVKQHETALEELRERGQTSIVDERFDNPKDRLQQVQRVTSAYKALIASEPTLPTPESPLPALLALRKTLNLVDQSKRTIQDVKQALSSANAELRLEDQNLRDARHLTKALDDRIEKLRLDKTEQAKKSTNEVAAALVSEQQRGRQQYAQELRNLVRAFNKFINEHLSVMLAAEDLGGPVVGEALDLDKETLKAGFTQQGKPKKAAANDDKAEAKRYQRNLQIWGKDNQALASDQIDSEAEAAGAKFRDLTETLLNAAAETARPNPYIHVKREDAAVLFLVRAKVAQFHPKDARKLRLLDFGAD